tara:strand:- start:5311 stop:6096 length:786 start_codon:yes stop_codon:yes gene_type:complete
VKNVTHAIQVGAHPVFSEALTVLPESVEQHITLMRNVEEVLPTFEQQTKSFDVAVVRETLCKIFKTEDTESRFSDLGLKSVQLLQASVELTKELETTVSVTQFYRYPTIDKLANAIANPSNNKATLQHNKTDSPVQIVGMACKFTGAENLERFWERLQDGRCTLPKSGNKGICTGQLLDTAGFDYSFFNISKTEADMMDPQQKLTLEIGWQAMVDAGLNVDDSRKNVGVFIDDTLLQRALQNKTAYSYSVTSNLIFLKKKL